jgi:hypothetical protein
MQGLDLDCVIFLTKRPFSFLYLLIFEQIY